MRVMKRIALLLAAALLPWCAARAEASIETAYAALSELMPAESVELIDQPDYVGGKAVRVSGSEQGMGYEIWIVFETERDVRCVFYGSPDTFTVPDGQRENLLVFLNTLNADPASPTVYLTDYGYPAGHAAITLPEDGDEALKLFAQNTVVGAVRAMQLIAGSNCYASAAPTPEPTSPPITVEEESESATASTGGHIEYVYADKPCPMCHTTGDCWMCHGTGVYRMYGQTVDCDKFCSYCNGTGYYQVLEPVFVADD